MNVKVAKAILCMPAIMIITGVASLGWALGVQQLGSGLLGLAITAVIAVLFIGAYKLGKAAEKTIQEEKRRIAEKVVVRPLSDR